MCLVALAIDQSRRFPLVVASNRDEFFARPAARLAWWTPDGGGPAILGGRDLESGGTWMGLTAQGRLALLTNVRGGPVAGSGAPTRGRIVTDWLAAREDTGDFWMRTSLSGFNGFNLVAADFSRGECFWGSNAGAHTRRLERGVYGLSNGTLDAPWPKVVGLKAALQAAMGATSDVDELAARLFDALGDRSVAPDASLPHTGIPLERERQLSPAFIRMPDAAYGTRCSTLIITERSGRQPVTHVFERSFNASGAVALLRRTTLRNWPPRYVQDDAHAPVEAGEVMESESTPASLSLEAPVGRTRVRSLLKPVAARRRKRRVAETADH
jgi:uncharacterized protein with NRDE domain